MWLIIQVRSTSKLKLNYRDLFDQESVMKTTQDNKMIDRIGTVYVENETELPYLIGPGVIYDKNQTTQWRD